MQRVALHSLKLNAVWIYILSYLSYLIKIIAIVENFYSSSDPPWKPLSSFCPCWDWPGCLGSWPLTATPLCLLGYSPSAIPSRFVKRLVEGREFRCFEVKLEESHDNWTTTSPHNPLYVLHHCMAGGCLCHSSMAEHWLHKPGVLDSIFPVNACLFTIFSPHNI